jgi:sugar lactone lactonase YvrE
MAVDRAGRRCYFPGAGDTVHVFSAGGQRLTSWKTGLSHGAGLIAVRVDDSVYVADASTIKRLTGDGTPLAAWGVGNIGTLVGLAVDAQGRVYVAASETKQIVRYVP